MRRRLARLLILAAPSVPLGLRGRVAATPVSVPGPRGEARPGAGSGHPELLLNYRPPPELRQWLNDFTLAGVVDSWAEQVR